MRIRTDLKQPLIWLHRAVGVGVGVALMHYLVELAQEPQAHIPFVTSLMLVVALPHNEGARPYAVVLGHFLSCVAGLVVVKTIGSGINAAELAVGLAALMMLAARAVHPPAAINPLLITIYDMPLSWAFSPILTGAIMVVGYAALWSGLERLLITKLKVREPASEASPAGQDDTAAPPRGER